MKNNILTISVRQKGQAIVFMLLTSGVVLLLGIFLLRAGIITSEKMQLQNAADAVAYSVSTIEARDLNFTAYTNRAMVANEVAIGQMVGLMSWAAHFASLGPFLNLYLNPLLSSLEAGTLGVAAFFTVPMRALILGLTTAGNAIRGGVQTVTKAVIPVLTNMNSNQFLSYSVAQKSFHIASFAFSFFTIFEVMRQNSEDAVLSGFGVASLMGHVSSYYSFLSSINGPFVSSYTQDSNDDQQKSGMEKFASITNASRDPFSENRFDPVSPFSNDPEGGWSFPLFPPYPLPPIDFTAAVDVDPLGISTGCPTSITCVFSLSIYFQIALERYGGTDLRYVEKDKQQLYTWSGADTTSILPNISVDLYLFGVNVPIPIPSAGAPIGIGAAQAGRATGPNSAFLGSASPTPIGNMLPDNLGGDVALQAYGGSPEKNPLSWGWSSPIPVGPPSQQAFVNNVGNNYLGLPRFNDTKTGPDLIDPTAKVFGFEAPYFMIGLTKASEDFEENSSGNATASNRARVATLDQRYQLNSNHAADQLAVIAKSEVYFNRPNDLSYFQRADGAIEYGSGFNPYWQARLVDTTYFDRTLALSMQQQQLWLPSFSLGPLLDDINNVLDLLP